MELMVAVGLAVLVIAGVASITSFVAKRFHGTGADQAQSDAYARITGRLAREFEEVVSWHMLRPDRLVYTSSFVAAGEHNEPYVSAIVCQKAGADTFHSLVYQRLTPVSAAPAAAPPGGPGATPRPLMEVPIATRLSKCAIEFGVLTATEASEQKAVHWVASLAPNDLGNVTHMRITLANGTGLLPPLFIVKKKNE